MWDVLLLDGLDVLFRIALGILRSHEAELLRCDSIPAVYVALESLPTRMWQPEKLLQVRSNLCLYAVAVNCSLYVWLSSSLTFVRLSFTLILSRSARHTSMRYAR